MSDKKYTTPSYRRILAVKLADLGDLLTVTPALQALRAAHPLATIDLLTPPSSAYLLRGAPYIDDVITFDKFPFDSLKAMLDPGRVLDTITFLLRLRLVRYDALAIFHHFTTGWGTLKFAVVSMAIGARTRAGLDNGRGSFLTRRVVDCGFGAMHEAEYWLQVAGLLGANVGRGWAANIPLDTAQREAADTLLESMGINYASPLVAIHPGAGAYSRARIWPVERFAEVAAGLIKSHDATVVIVGGPDEADTADRLESLVGNRAVHNLAGRTTIQETAALIERCKLFMGNDSGPMHIAAAVGTPVVAVFGPSNVEAWRPYTPAGVESPHRVVARDLPCMPCFYRGHSLGLREGCGPRPCLTRLGAEPVLKACYEVLESAARAVPVMGRMQPGGSDRSYKALLAGDD